MSEIDVASDGAKASGEGRPLAYHHRQGSGPTIIFLPGYMSDMEGSKALALDAWAQRHNRAFIRFDYGGCGASGGAFEAQTLNDWRDDVLAIVDELAQGRVLLVGSSMGGWLMLHAALARPDRIAALIGIAAAPDFTSWGFSQDEKMTILQEGRLEKPSPHSDQPTVITRDLWQSGEGLRLLHAEIAIDCPARLLHGLEDQDVPWGYGLELLKKLRSPQVQLNLIKDGDHRLSRDQDIALLIATLEELLEVL